MLTDRIASQADRLTPTERRIAAVLSGEPQVAAFGTVALVARRAQTSGPSVVRLAVKLGYGGFVELQADVQRDLARHLGPARDRIRREPPADLLAEVIEIEQRNVARTLERITPYELERTVARLADPAARIWVLPGDTTGPIGAALAVPLGQLRDDVTLLTGSAVTAGRMLGGLRRGDTLVAVDIRRYERWLVDLASWAHEEGADIVAVTDSPLSPLARHATEVFYIGADGVGPFDSLTGGVALAGALVAGVAARLRASATERLDRIESAWSAGAAMATDVGNPLGSPAPAARLSRLADTDAVAG